MCYASARQGADWRDRVYLQRHFPGLALGTCATFALCLSCGESGGSSTETGGGPTDSSGGTGASAVGPTGATATGGGGTPGGGTGGVVTDTGGAGAVATTGGTGAVAGTGGTGAVADTGGTGAVADTGGAGAVTDTGGTGGIDGTGGGGASTGGTGGSGTYGPSAGCGTPTQLTSGRASIDVDGKAREYILELPADYDPTHPYKLVFGWHPWGGSAQQTADMGYFGLESVSNGEAILVAPEGQDYQDNGLGWGNENGEDIAFLHAMLDRFGSELCVDQDRIFSTGFSFGAMFSFTLACNQESMMRAIAPQAGNTFTSGGCENGTRSVATMAFIGTDDTLLDGHRQAVQVFVERNGCTAQTAPMDPSWCDDLASNYQPCTCVEYQDCAAGYPVIECEYTAGHQFAPNSGATLWEFFSQF